MMHPRELPANAPRIGLLAGWGRLPLLVAQALNRQGVAVVGLGVKDHVSPELRRWCTAYREVGLARLGACIRFLRRHGAQQATMAGKIHKVLMFQRFAWIKHFPDPCFLSTFYPHWLTRTKDRKDDTLLGALVGAYQRYGIEIRASHGLRPGATRATRCSDAPRCQRGATTRHCFWLATRQGDGAFGCRPKRRRQRPRRDRRRGGRGHGSVHSAPVNSAPAEASPS